MARKKQPIEGIENEKDQNTNGQEIANEVYAEEESEAGQDNRLTEAVFTYVGKGEDPPRKIDFCGQQEFIRGKATKVTNKLILAKLISHPCFVQGEVDMESLHSQDELAAKKAAAQRQEDLRVNAAFTKRHGTE